MSGANVIMLTSGIRPPSLSSSSVVRASSVERLSKKWLRRMMPYLEKIRIHHTPKIFIVFTKWPFINFNNFSLFMLTFNHIRVENFKIYFSYSSRLF